MTPTGYADAISPDGSYFVMPEEKKMSLAAFLASLDGDKEIPHYIQKQNSNLTEEFHELFEDISELDWASEAFGKKPDAVNFWMGDRRCVTSSKTCERKCGE